MPMPGCFVICAAPIVDALTDKASCIAIVDYCVAVPYQMPEDATDEYREQFKDVRFSTPQLATFAQWWQLKRDAGKEFEQRLVILAPDGKETALAQTSAFRFKAPYHRVLQPLPPFGIRMGGIYLVKFEIREGCGEWEPLGGFPLLIVDSEQAEALQKQAVQPSEESGGSAVAGDTSDL